MAFPEYDDSQPKKWSGRDGVPAGSGLYVIYLTRKDNLPKDWQDLLWREDRILYIGKGESGLEKRLRHHFDGRRTLGSKVDSKQDTFRRSMGAILRKHLNLKVGLLPLGSKSSKYGFKDEEKLSRWIRENCEFAWVLDRNFEGTEKDLIEQFDPPVNLSIPIDLKDHTKYKEARKKLKQAREECWRLASGHGQSQ